MTDCEACNDRQGEIQDLTERLNEKTNQIAEWAVEVDQTRATNKRLEKEGECFRYEAQRATNQQLVDAERLSKMEADNERLRLVNKTAVDEMIRANREVGMWKRLAKAQSRMIREHLKAIEGLAR